MGEGKRQVEQVQRIGESEELTASAAAGAENIPRIKLGSEILRSRWTLVIILISIILFVWLIAYLQGVSGLRLFSLTVRGIMLGSIIALAAVGLSLVYGVVRFPNFSHGDLMTVGAYITLALFPLFPTTNPVGPFAFGWELLFFLVLVSPLVGLFSAGIDRVIYRPLRERRSSLVILAMSSLAMAFFIRSFIYLGWGADFRFFYPGRPRPAIDLIFGIRVRPDQLFIFGLTVVLIFLLYLLLEKTKIGKAMRATADNIDLARVTGINTDQIIFWTWFIGGTLAAIGGIMYGLDAQLRPEMGFFFLIPLFAAVIVGSIGNPYGALAGAFLIGIVWQVSTAFISPTYGPGMAFLIMILVLIIRPQGIFGRPGG